MPDENDIIFSPQLDIEGIARWFVENLFGADFGAVAAGAASWWYVFSIVSFAVSALLLVGIVYSMIRYAQFAALEQEGLRAQERAYQAAHEGGGTRSDARWQQVRARVSTDNPDDWRLAILEADIMLDELLNTLGYAGESIADKLKGARPESFRSIEDAWEAHKVRNAVAHQGSDFALSKRVAQETVARFGRVFEEFAFV